MNANIWVHNLDPYLVRFSDSLGLRWYGLSYLFGFVAGGLLMRFMVRRSRAHELPPRMIADFLAACILGTMIGGRLGYALLYSPSLFAEWRAPFPYWGLLRVWEGGMASHGGIAGIFLACVIFATLQRRTHRLHWLHLADLATLGGTIGIFFGRCANFLNGELFGRIAPSGSLWAVKFPAEVYVWLQKDLAPARFSSETDRATPAVHALGSVDITQWGKWLSNLHHGESIAEVRGVLEQVIRAIQSGNESVTAALATQLTPRYPSQLIEAALEGALVFAALFFYWRRPRKPGAVASVFLVLYSLARILSEEFREPDAHLGFGALGLTRGQWLSLGFFFIGVVSYLACQKRPAKPMGGWWGHGMNDGVSPRTADKHKGEIA